MSREYVNTYFREQDQWQALELAQIRLILRNSPRIGHLDFLVLWCFIAAIFSFPFPTLQLAVSTRLKYTDTNASRLTLSLFVESHLACPASTSIFAHLLESCTSMLDSN